ncbi:MAG TPA: LysE family translocator [Candidatus Cybelea sp.]|nr:LysE family translocator [Candidatus Cybelea sp.]
MIDAQLYLAFFAAVTLLMLMPGPNVALIVANSVAYGTRFGLMTVLGTSTAMVVQLAFTAYGMTAALGVLADWFDWVRWVGVAYLVYLGIRQWRAPALPAADIAPKPKSLRAIFARGLLVSLTNPKTLFFYGAFFPQFVDVSKPVAGQLALLSATFLGIALTVDTGWSLAAGRVRGYIAAHAKLQNRLSGGLLIGAGLSLALARR